MLLKRGDLEKRERVWFAPYATFADAARREFPDERDEFRTEFQRDHARIIHSKAFRRLKGKTQVFVASHGDHFRNRLTHSLEVSQISRSLARNLAVNEDLAGAIALAHDLGHTPFGHAGEDRLDSLLQKFGKSFEHNRQSRRILQILEKKYPDSEGLNLTLDLLDGLAKHATIYDAPEKIDSQPSLEAQIVNLADEIAYTNHDLEDGLRAGIFTREDLKNLNLWQKALAKVDAKLPTEAFNHRAVSAIIDLLNRDLLENSAQNLKKHAIDSLPKVRNFAEPLVGFSPKMQADLVELRQFLRQNFYLAPAVAKLSNRGADILEKLFTTIHAQQNLLPPEFARRLKIDPPEIVVADFVAGMTDNFAEDFLVRAE
ncbi:MAG: dNTP triphosphohydrolase [Patescibacteria group bacterium]